METWPKALLPDPADIGYGGEIESSVVRTEFDSGYVRQRARSSQERTKLNVKWTFKPWQYLLFRAFVKDKITNGADQFNIELWFGDVEEACVARIVDGVYSHNYIEGLWMVSAVLEVEEVPAMSESDYDEIIELAEDPELLMIALTEFNTFVDESFYEHLT